MFIVSAKGNVPTNDPIVLILDKNLEILLRLPTCVSMLIHSETRVMIHYV